jgi:hypothetical protein
MSIMKSNWVGEIEVKYVIWEADPNQLMCFSTNEGTDKKKFPKWILLSISDPPGQLVHNILTTHESADSI